MLAGGISQHLTGSTPSPDLRQQVGVAVIAIVKRPAGRLQHEPTCRRFWSHPSQTSGYRAESKHFGGHTMENAVSFLQASNSKNLLLAAMSPDDSALFRPTATRVQLTLSQMLEEAHKPIEFVYFIETGLGSVVAGKQFNVSVEVGLFGRDGMSGTALVLGDTENAFDSIMQIKGSAIRVSADNLRSALLQSPSMTKLLTGYARALGIQTSCTAWANADVVLQGRLARWILMVDDRVEHSHFNMTHELLSILLSVRRASVTDALKALGERQLIEVLRHEIGVIDRAGLIALTRGTYGMGEGEYARATGIPLSH